MVYDDKKLGRKRKGVGQINSGSDSKKMKSKFGGFCVKCSTNFTEGTLINYFFESKTAEHVRCPSTTAPAAPGRSDLPAKPVQIKKEGSPVPKKSDPSPFRQDQYDTFRYKVLPDWAAILAEHKVDITLFDAEGKKEVLKMFREYWDSTPPF